VFPVFVLRKGQTRLLDRYQLSLGLEQNTTYALLKIPVTGTGIGNYKPGLWIRIRIGYGFSDFVDPDPYWESGSRIRIQGQES
jgi:hypothetical protein